MSNGMCAQSSCNRMPAITRHEHRPCEGKNQTINRCYDVNGCREHITNTNQYNNFYNRYNHYYVTQRNFTTDYVTDYNIYHYNQENIYNGCYSLGSYDIMANGSSWGSGSGQGWGQGQPSCPVNPPCPCQGRNNCCHCCR